MPSKAQIFVIPPLPCLNIRVSELAYEQTATDYKFQHQPHPYRIGLCSVLRPLQHSIGYMGDSFTGQKTQPTVSKY